VLHELEETGHFTSADIFIVSPSGGKLSDENSRNEDGGTMNNLTAKQLLQCRCHYFDWHHQTYYWRRQYVQTG